MSSKPSIDATFDPNRVYQLSDLENWEFSGTPLAVLGHPIQHSVSPHMHNAALLSMSQLQLLFSDWRYFKFDVHPNDLPEALEKLNAAGFRGVNLTIPHKVDAVGLVKEIDPVAERMGAVNTLFSPEGAGFSGFNSDGFGMATAIERSLKVSLKEKPVVLLGAGGAARAAAVQSVVSGSPEIWIGNRNQERLKDLLKQLDGFEGGERIKPFVLNELPSDLPKDAVIINATSLGLKAEDPAPIDLQVFSEESKVYDMIYSNETRLLKYAKEQGLSVADGLSMLVWQGVRSLEIWSGASVPAQPMMTAACKALNIAERNV